MSVREFWARLWRGRPVEEADVWRGPNPLGARVGRTLVIDTAEYAGQCWAVRALRLLTPRPGDGPAPPPAVEYDLRHGTGWATLRLTADPPPAPLSATERAPPPHYDRAYLYRPEKRLPWGDEVRAFLERQATAAEAYAWSGVPYTPGPVELRGQLTELYDWDGDGRISARDLRRQPYTLWWYRRAAGAPPDAAEYLQVLLRAHHYPASGVTRGGDKTLLVRRGVAVDASRLIIT